MTLVCIKYNGIGVEVSGKQWPFPVLLEGNVLLWRVAQSWSRPESVPC